jgi:hypothetical protein
MVPALVLACLLAAAPEAQPRSEAAQLFDKGQAKYATHDYTGAIEDFTAAYALAQELEEDSVRDQVLARLAFNLARAHVAAFDVDGDANHLVLARRLLADYRGHERAQGNDPDADTDVRRLEKDLLERERSVPGHGSDENEPTVDAASSKRARTQMRVGISLLALAPALAAPAIAGAVMGARARTDFESVTTGDARLDARRRGRVGDVLLGVGAGLAGVSAIVGVTLIVVSRQGSSSEITLGASPSGVLIGGRF